MTMLADEHECKITSIHTSDRTAERKRRLEEVIVVAGLAAFRCVFVCRIAYVRK